MVYCICLYKSQRLWMLKADLKNSLPTFILLIVDSSVPRNTLKCVGYIVSTEFLFFKYWTSKRLKTKNLSDHFILETSIRWLTLVFSIQTTKSTHLFYIMWFKCLSPVSGYRFLGDRGQQCYKSLIFPKVGKVHTLGYCVLLFKFVLCSHYFIGLLAHPSTADTISIGS